MKQKHTFLKYAFLCIALISANEILKNILHFDKLLFNSLSEQLTNKQIEQFLNIQKKWNWMGYIFFPIFLIIKTSLITSTLYIGTFFSNTSEIKYKNLFSIVIVSEFIFLLVPIFKIAWFYFFEANYDLVDIQYFYPLSAINIIGYDGIEQWYIYPLQVLNLFELTYIILLSYKIGKLTKSNTDKGLKIVCISYLPALFLWVFIVMFFTLNNN
jgi:hypothetical protein